MALDKQAITFFFWFLKLRFLRLHLSGWMMFLLISLQFFCSFSFFFYDLMLINCSLLDNATSYGFGKSWVNYQRMICCFFNFKIKNVITIKFKCVVLFSWISVTFLLKNLVIDLEIHSYLVFILILNMNKD